MFSLDPAGRAAVAWLFSPHTIEEFVTSYYERAPLHVCRDTQGFYDRYFSLAEFERILFGSKLTTEELRAVKDGVEARRETYTVRPDTRFLGPQPIPESVDIDPDRVSALFAHGCTINMNSVHKLSPSAFALAREFESFFGCAANANVYLTPAGNQGFGAHYDTHDTFILQVQGSKRWRVYDTSMQLPLDHQVSNRLRQKPGELLFEADLRAGDLLYLPRGFFHEGKSNDSLSLHITYGLFPPRRIAVIFDALMEAAENDVRLRKSAMLNDTEIVSVIQEVLTAKRLDETLERMRTSFATERRNGLDGQLQQIAALEHLSETSIVAKRSGISYNVAEGAESTLLSFSGKTVKLPKAAAAIVHALENVSRVKVAALLAHDPKALGIVKRLIQEGFAIQCESPDYAGRESVA